MTDVASFESVRGLGPARGAHPDEWQLWERVVTGEYPRHAGRALGIHPARVAYLCAKWGRRGFYNWGVSVDLGWIND